MVKPRGAKIKRRSTCPYCGARVRPDRLWNHIKKTHPEGDVSAGDKARVRAWKMEKRRKAAQRNAMYIVPVLIVVMLLLVYFVFYYKAPSEPSVKPGDKAPDIDPMEDTQDVIQNIPEQHYGHHYLFIEFFSTQCGHCDRAAKPLNWLFANYSDRVVFYSIASESPDDIRYWKEQHNSPWSFLYDEKDDAFGTFVPNPQERGVPNFFIIDNDPDGPFIRDHFTGDMQNPSDPTNDYDAQYAYEHFELRLKNVLDHY